MRLSYRWGVRGMVLALAWVSMTACSGPQAPPPAAKAPPPAAPAVATAAPAPATPPASPACAQPPPCGDHCANVPYVKTDCWTTPHGAAPVDVVISADGNPLHSTNMLLCDSGPYALCFYSGPPDATGKTGNPPLPCTMNADGTVGNCTCKYFSSGASFIDMNGILNLNAWYKTVQECGPDGSGCANMSACGSGNDASSKACNMKEATVCTYLRDQNAKQPEKSLVPGYDVISDFSMKLATDYNMSKVTDCSGAYLGCMTAGCRFPNGTAPADGGTVQCDCPVAKGPYQIGQTGDNVTCAIAPSNGTSYLWSAARTVTGDKVDSAK